MIALRHRGKQKITRKWEVNLITHQGSVRAFLLKRVSSRHANRTLTSCRLSFVICFSDAAGCHPIQKKESNIFQLEARQAIPGLIDRFHELMLFFIRGCTIQFSHVP